MNNEICFIIFSESDAGFEECRERLKKLDVPAGMRVRYGKLIAAPENALSMSQNAINSASSRYKVYLWEDTWIIQKDFLPRAISFFHEHPDYGILGLQGAKVRNGKFSDFQALGAFYGIIDGHLKKVMQRNKGDGCMEADILSGMLVMTQYDIPWRSSLFFTRGSFAASQAMEFKRHGYRAGVFSQKEPWCIWCAEAHELNITGDDARLLSYEYGDDLSQGITPIWKSYNYNQTVESQIDAMKRRIYSERNSNVAASNSYKIGNVLYNYNQKYTDDFLENQLLRLEALWGKEFGGRDYTPKQRTVLFYDRFGLDTRGLAQIYLDAIGEAGWHVIYVAKASRAEGKIPVLEALLKKYNAKIVYLPDHGSQIEEYYSLCETIYTYHPECGFLYTGPADVPGILAFMHFAGKMRRYQINLTDHAFWLGRNAFDYCLEFRDYGAAISAHCRRIPKEKLVYMPYYPAINKDIEFQGFPFEKNENDFVIFSGGSLYKTIDKDGTYYRIVDRVLEKHPQVKFWYAGAGEEDSYMKTLLEKWPGRAFYTPERKDLYSLLKHVDMYLNTYPMGGGLMVQYSMAAGKVPMSIVQDDRMSGLFTNSRFLRFSFYDEDSLLNSITRFIEDESYRESLENGIESSILTRDEFHRQMVRLLQTPKTYESVPPLPDTSRLRQECFERFITDYVK